jgi:hypothetical protein
VARERSLGRRPKGIPHQLSHAFLVVPTEPDPFLDPAKARQVRDGLSRIVEKPERMAAQPTVLTTILTAAAACCSTEIERPHSILLAAEADQELRRSRLTKRGVLRVDVDDTRCALGLPRLGRHWGRMLPPLLERAQGNAERPTAPATYGPLIDSRP